MQDMKQSRNRTASDVMSGLMLSRDHAVCEKFSEDSLTQMFATFQEFDMDRSGFISVDNLKAICEAQLVNMIMEVAILTGHENDGKLSFRDYCALHAYEVLLHKKKGDTDEEADE